MTVSQATPSVELSEELLDSLLANYKKPEDIMGENGLIKQLTRAVVERALKAEMTEHLGYPKLIKNRASFPSDESLIKLLYLALQNVAKKWTMPIRDWKAALNRFNIQFDGRMPK